jgi:colicin import membrane protein
MKTWAGVGFGHNPSAHSGMGGMFVVSLILHLTAVTALFLLPNLASSRTYYSPSLSVRLVNVAPLPDTARQPAAPPAPETTLPPAAPAPPKPKLKEKPVSLASVAKEPVEKKPVEKNIDEAIDRIRQRQESKKIDSAIENIRSEKETRQVNSAIENIRKRVTIGTSGAVETGEAGTGGASTAILSLKHKMYYNLIWQRIRSVWVLPEEALRGQKNLETIITIRIAKDGQIENIQFEQKSGNALLDESALRAIKKANPFPPLPPGMEEEKFDVGVRFKPSELTG